MLGLLNRIAVVLLVIQIAYCTSLTDKNCPSGFTVATANVTVDSSAKSLVNLIYGGIYSSEDQANIKASIFSGDTNSLMSYVTSIRILLPFIAIAIAFGLAFIIALCCCVFEKSCPPCKSWKRDFSRRPYQKTELRCVTLFAILFALGIAVTTIIGFVYFPQLQDYITMTKCSMYSTLDIAINGDQSNNWGGFSQLKSQIGNISSLLSTASTSISTNLAGNDWLVTSMSTLNQMNTNLYINNNQSKVYSPNSLTASNNPLPTVTPLFISSGLGPNGTANTMVTDIDSGLQVTAKASNQGYSVYTSAFLLANSATNISSNANTCVNSLSMTTNFLDGITIAVDTFSNTVFDKIFNWGLYLIQGVLAFIVAASILILLGVVATHSFELLSCKASVHLGWIAYGITYFGIIAISFMLLSLGGISYSFCQFYEGIILNQQSFISYSQSSTSNDFSLFFQKLNVCFYGDGNIMKQFSINKQMQTVSNLFAQITTFTNMMSSSNANYVNINVSPTKISGWINAMGKYQSGIYVDADTALTTEDNPYVALQGLNKHSNNGTGGIPPCCTNDYWVFDKTNCTFNSTESIYNSTLTNGTTFLSGNTCISFNEKVMNNSNNIWSYSDVVSRYVAVRQCQNSTACYSTLMNYMTAAINYRDSRINLYQSLIDQLNALLTANNNFNTQLIAFSTKVSSFYASVSTLNSLVTSQINGLDSSNNCTTIANNLRFVYNAFCINFLYRSVQFGVCCLMLLAIMVGGMLTGSVFAVRYGRVQKDRKVIAPETPSIDKLHSETFSKREDSSQSSDESD